MRSDDNDGQDEAWQHDGDDVIERFTMQMNCENDTTERSLTTAVKLLRCSDRNACIQSFNSFI